MDSTLIASGYTCDLIVYCYEIKYQEGIGEIPRGSQHSSSRTELGTKARFSFSC